MGFIIDQLPIKYQLMRPKNISPHCYLPVTLLILTAPTRLPPSHLHTATWNSETSETHRLGFTDGSPPASPCTLKMKLKKIFHSICLQKINLFSLCYQFLFTSQNHLDFSIISSFIICSNLGFHHRSLTLQVLTYAS